MRALPADRRLSTLVVTGADVDVPLRAVARSIARLHADPAARAVDVSPATRAGLLDRWVGDVAELLSAVDDRLGSETTTRVETIDALASAYVRGRTPLLEARISDGRIVDGHGDLLADDVFCLPDGPRILDCLEFDDHLRVGDAFADIAFLVMDLERLGAPGAARRFVDAYREFSDDAGPASLLDHYVAARALVRAKVAALRAAQGGTPSEDAGQLVALCENHLRAALPVLVLVGGVPGSGKSTLARALAERLDAVWLQSDLVRKDLAGVPHVRTPIEGVDAALYAPEMTTRTYAELERRAAELLGMGESVVVDATFSSAGRRDALRRVARAAEACLVELRCDAPADVLTRRVAARRVGEDDPSDATVEVLEAVAARFDAWPEAHVVATERPGHEALDEASGAVAAVRSGPWPAKA
jgi:predicted kinase